MRSPRKRSVDRNRMHGMKSTLAFAFGLPGIDFERLSDDELSRLADLVDKIVVPHGVDLAALDDRERERLEALAGKSAGLAEDHLSAQRQRQAEVEKTKNEEANMRRMPFTRDEQTNFFRRIFEGMADEDLWVDDAAVLTAILAQFASGRTLISTSYFEGEGDGLTLRLNANMGLVGNADGAGTLAGWKARVVFLADEGWLWLDRKGPEWQVRFGPKLRDALAGAAMPIEQEVVA